MGEWGEWLQALFRWIHVVAGVLWIGLLYFFNWINGPVGAALDAETKQKVLPELLPRTLYYFRWGAAFTWITGILLLGLVYYMNKGLMAEDAAVQSSAIMYSAIAFLGGAIIYDLLWKSPLAANQSLGVAVSFVLLCGVMYGLNSMGVSPRALYIHVGALLGTAMAMNVWMRIWPAQRKIIAAIKAGEAPDGDLKALAGLRSKHNTYMSVPLIFIMVSNHYPGIYGFGGDQGWIVLAAIIAVGWVVTNMIYKQSKTEKVAAY
jgi:uncharacterized membrane protein